MFFLLINFKKAFIQIRFGGIPGKSFPMKLYSSIKKILPANDEKKSAKLIVEKMGVPKNELERISEIYGVSASQLLKVIYSTSNTGLHIKKQRVSANPGNQNLPK